MTTVLSNVVLRFPAGPRRVYHLGECTLTDVRDAVGRQHPAGTVVIEPSTETSVMTYTWDGLAWQRGALQLNALPTACRPGDDQYVVIGPVCKAAPKGTPKGKRTPKQPWVYAVSVTGRTWSMTAQQGKTVHTSTGALEGDVTPGLATVLAAATAALKGITLPAHRIGAVTLSLSDRNAAAILRGEKTARKTAALAAAALAEVERLGARVL